MVLSDEQEREVDRLLATANLQRMRDQWTNAEDSCRTALSISPGDVTVREMLGDILHEMGKLDMALAEFRTALEHAPGKPSLETKYAKVTLEIAEREREKAIAQDMIANPQRYTKRERSPVMAMVWAIVPGMGQFYNGEMVKACVIWGTLLLFVLCYAFLQQPYPPNVDSLQLFLIATNPFVLAFGVLFFIAYVYGLIDAPIMAEKSSKSAKKSIA
jgi:hypothetical protein